MIKKRIIPCLDVKNGSVVKGIHFVGLKEVGDPVELAETYNRQGADELVFLDISATQEARKTMISIVEKTAEKVFIPFTVGGGISETKDIVALLRAGADKVSLNSAAIKNPGLISEAASMFGSQCVVLAVDGKLRPDGNGWTAYIHGGTIDTGIDALDWIEEGVRKGAGEILLTSMDADGTKAGFDIPFLKAVRSRVHVPVIASGGGGTLEHFAEVFQEEAADAALAASLFHYGEYTVRDVKEYLSGKGIPMRL
ncbi:MAG: imidazole glycerol phosphate synthase subunit HisF [Solobacterium sp.]|nr:imidazole glycerol phosphate synthase subunit HisF [Solobacterium sp.]